MAKKGRGEKSLPAEGHNSDELCKEYVRKAANIQIEIISLNGDLKNLLNDAKNDGFLKTAIRNALKNLKMTEEQRQAQAEIDSETIRITELCSDLPLFLEAA